MYPGFGNNDAQYDDAKRQLVLAERGLDFAQANRVFEAFHLSRADVAHSGSEVRVILVRLLGDEVVIVVWTARRDVRRIITMWKANEKEREAYERQRERAG